MVMRGNNNPQAMADITPINMNNKSLISANTNFKKGKYYFLFTLCGMIDRKPTNLNGFQLPHTIQISVCLK